MLLASLKLLPSVALVTPFITVQAVAVGQEAARDSTSIRVVFSANGGEVTRGGLYTAGSVPGTFRVIASVEGLTDTSTVTVIGGPDNSASDRSGTESTPGIPFGLFDAWRTSGLKRNTDSFTASIGSTTPSNILERIAVARARGMKLILTMTGGAHQNYMTNGAFDLVKWRAKMDAYDTPAIKAAVSAAVADGTIIGNSVMDEPHVSGVGDGNTWGPRGTITKERVDQMCGYVKEIFPMLPVGVVHPHKAFEPSRSYRICDFMVDQYSWRQGDVVRFRDQGLAQGRRDGIAVAFSMNILNGGIQAARDGLWDCQATMTGGRGTYKPNCRMSPEQVREWGQLLGVAGCALVMWRYDDAFMSNPDNQRAFADIASRLKTVPAKPCRR
jgi:hypothetical protein